MLVKAHNLIKRYNGKLAVDNVNLEIAAGEIFGFLGPNGAGKSTTINMLCGLLRADQGTVEIDGIDLHRNPLEVKRRLGLVPQEIAVFDTLSAAENVEFFAKLAGLRGQTLEERVEEALAFVGLAKHRKEPPKSFSGGMKRRLNIACAIAHHPKLIIMDEPTVGIDPQSRNHILESVRELNKMGSTILYTSHYMEEVEAVCNRLAIIDHGRLIAQGTKEELKQLVGEEEKILIEIVDCNHNPVQEIRQVNGVRGVDLAGNTLTVVTPNSQTVMQDVLFILSRHNVRVRGIKLVEPDLETVFLSLTGRNLRD